MPSLSWEELARDLRLARHFRDQIHLAPAAAATPVTAIRTPTPSRPELTPREREVVVLVAQGRTNQQIATRLGVTERTAARTHVSSILAKLGLTSRTRAAMWAACEGLTEPP
jgi:DNA-binding NarL/FixJ family response regulator